MSQTLTIEAVCQTIGLNIHSLYSSVVSRSMYACLQLKPPCYTAEHY